LFQAVDGRQVTLKKGTCVTKPEILSPAGHWPQLHAAIEAGADAVYFGLTHFTARAKVGFTLPELPEAMRTLHRRGVKGYVTYNSLVFDSELRDAARGLAAIAEAGADAIIVQDWAVVKLAREIAPGLDIHGSTQMSITSAEGVRVARDLGAARVVMARELSLDEVRAVARGTAGSGCGIEIFVHGALCVSYSGQCFSSEAWGGRSANRGQCAQACRLPYEMLVDGRLRPLGDARYLLSPGDLYALRQIPEIVSMGVAGLKIEGRYKDADYVALATRAYRKAVDEACSGLAQSLTPAEEAQIEQVYSRGLGPWFLTGTDHQAVVKGRSPRHRGLRMGRVVSLGRNGVTVEPAEAQGLSSLKPGDGVVFDAADWRSPQEPEEGGRLYSVERQPDGLLELRFANGAINPGRIRPGDLVWRTDDPATGKDLRALTDASLPVRKQPVRVRAVARVGSPLQLEWSLDGCGNATVTVTSAEPLGAAQNRALSADLLMEQLGRLGNTVYELAGVDLDLDLEGSPFAPVSMLNQLRRQAVERLETLQSAPPRIEIADPDDILDRLMPVPAAAAADVSQTPKLHLLVRAPEQLDAALEARPASITLDYLDLYGLRPALDRVKQAGIEARVASPRVLKPGEERIAEFLLRCECPILVRSAGLLDRLTGIGRELHGDFSLNAANRIAAHELLARGLERLAPTHDLNAQQVTRLAREAGADRIEAIVYQHLPVFHTEHCVFCRFLSTGTSYRDCGRPCEKHRVELRDGNGRAHPVMADVGCRNTVFGAEAQEASQHLHDWLDAGIRHFRVEFVHERAGEVARVARAFAGELAGSLAPGELHRRLQQLAPQGTTQGSLFVPPSSFALPVLQ
jgi:U32 family peptidase